MKTIQIRIDGMSCNHCVMRVKKAIDNLKGIEKSDVSIGHANVQFNDIEISQEEIINAITKSGYKVV